MLYTELWSAAGIGPTLQYVRPLTVYPLLDLSDPDASLCGGNDMRSIF